MRTLNKAVLKTLITGSAALLLLATTACGGGGGGSALPGDRRGGEGSDPNNGFNQGPGDEPIEDYKNPWDQPKIECDSEGASEICFDGDEALIDKGECRSGVRHCADGYWSPCIGQVVPVPEYCDFKDNDCDTQVDEGVLSSCGDCNPYCAVAESGAGTADPLTPADANSQNVVQTGDGWLTLTETAINLNVIWIANSAEGTVSKLDTTTGYEMGRYKVCSNPSRTAVGKLGDGWIACRSDTASVAYIINFDGECEDKNGNGTIETSRDLDNSHTISGAEMLPQGQDECVKWIKHTAGVPGNPAGANIARALGITQKEEGWVGLWESKQLVKVEKENGDVVQTISIPANPYGLVIDAEGIVWVSGRGGGVLVRADPASGQVSSTSPNGSYSPYGIALDEWGRVWTAHLGSGGNLVYMYDPKTNGWQSVGVSSRPRGLVSNGNGRLFVACDESDRVAVVDIATLTKFNEIHLGGGHFPIGMAVDSSGFIWAVNQKSGSAHKINGFNLQIIGNYPVGKGPYTYSDMTGSAFFDAVPPGWYRHRFEASQVGGLTGLAAMNNAIWGLLSIDYVAPPGAYIKFRVRTGATIEELEAAQWTPLVGPFPEQTFPVDLATVIEKSGHYLEVETRLYPSDDGDKPLLKGFDLKYETAP